MPNYQKNILDNLLRLRKRIALACQKVGRDCDEVSLLPVSKNHHFEKIKFLYDLGFKRMGENRIQELREKDQQAHFCGLEVQWSVIGSIQTNKAKIVAERASQVQSLDRMKLAYALDKYLQKNNRQMDVLIQINTSEESQKSGLGDEEVLSFVKELKEVETLRVKGLMTIALNSDHEQSVRACFKKLKSWQTRLQQEAPEGMSWETLSMGMSDDFELAIEEGATELRVGSTLFGQRDKENLHGVQTK